VALMMILFVMMKMMNLSISYWRSRTIDIDLRMCLSILQVSYLLLSLQYKHLMDSSLHFD